MPQHSLYIHTCIYTYIHTCMRQCSFDFLAALMTSDVVLVCCIIFCASHLGSLSSQRRNLQKARKVVPRIFSILDRQPFIDPFADVDLVTNKVIPKIGCGAGQGM